MGMGQELKDFVTGFSSGYKLATPSEWELKRRDKEADDAAIDKASGDYTSGIPGRGGVKPYTYKGTDETPDGAKAVTGRSPSFVMAENDPSMKSYLDTTIGKESGGNPSAKNQNSSATGLGQFTKGTWEALRKEHPELGLTPDGRTDPEQSKRALVVFTQKNAAGLKSAGFDPNPGNLYVSHFLGIGGAKKMLSGLNSDPNAPATSYADPASVAANRSVFYNPDGTPKSAAQFYKERTSKFQKRADAALDTGSDDDVQPTQMAAEGGAIMPVMTMPADDTPAAPPLPPRRPSDEDLQSVPENTQEPDYHKVAGLHEALDAGMSSIAKTFGLDGQSSALPDARSDRSAQIQRYHANEGAASPDDIRQIDQTIDPDNRLASDAKAVARLKAGYDYFLKKGDPDKAKKYAESILLYTRQAVQYAGASAEQKIRAGDVAGAAKDIQDAHNQIPDGSSLYVDKVNPDGKVDYRVVDEDGDLTERGQATTNQLLYLATGMKNGSEWLSQMQNARAGSLTAAQKLAEKRKAADEKAYGSYLDAGGGNQDVVSKLSPEAQDALKKMSPAVRARAIQELVSRDAQQRAQAGQDRAQAKDDRRQEYYQRREQAQDKKGQDQQEYAGHAAAVENARDALTEQMQADPDDTVKVQAAQKALSDAIGAARSWAAGDTGRAAYVPQLERIARPAGRGAGAGGRGGTEDERKVAGLDQQFTRFQRAVDRETDPQKKAQLQAQLPHQRASIEFQKRDTGYSDDIGTKVDQVIPSILGVKEGAQLSDTQETDASDYGTAVTGILRGDNALTPKRAADIAKLAVKTGKIEVLDNGAYSINGSDPVYMPPQAIAALARLRQRNQPKQQPTTVPNPMKPDAENTYTPTELDDIRASADRRVARESAAPARRSRNKSAEYNNLREQMGDEMYARVQKQLNKTDDTVPLAMMRRIVREQGRGAAFGRDTNIP